MSCTPYVSDNVDPSPSVTNNAPGDGFPRGSSIVTWRVTDDSGNSATDIQSITIVDTPAVDSTSTPDRFGIRDMYPTVSGGREWFSNWDNGVSRTVNSGQRDPYNSELIARGNGRVEIDGNGIARLIGTQPRMYVYDAPQLKKWDDIELTFYGRRVSESGTSSSAGFMAGVGDHHIQNLGDCNVNTYYAGMRYDGRMLFIKEIDHYDTSNAATTRPWSGVPRNEWVGFKAIISQVGPNSVNLQLYRDMTNGLNGGTWEKMTEYTDSGGWSVGAKCHGGSSNEVLTGASGSVFIRNTLVSNAEYKWFSVREI